MVSRDKPLGKAVLAKMELHPLRQRPGGSASGGEAVVVVLGATLKAEICQVDVVGLLKLKLKVVAPVRGKQHSGPVASAADFEESAPAADQLLVRAKRSPSKGAGGHCEVGADRRRSSRSKRGRRDG